MRLLITLAVLILPLRAEILLQGFYWDTQPPAGQSWWQHLSDLTPALRAWGVTAIWVPPPTKGDSGGYSMGYDIYDYYDLGSKSQKGSVATRFGSKGELLDLIGVAHANGLQVYLDIVANHRDGGQNAGFTYNQLAGAEGLGRFPMESWDFHHNGTTDWDKEFFGRDLAQELPYVRDGMFSWIRWLDRQTGCDGYRLDAVKHMDPSFLEGLLYQVQEGSGQSRFAVSEYWENNPDTMRWYVNATKGRSSVFDFTLRDELKAISHSNGSADIRAVRHRFGDDFHSVTFANNHDMSGRGNGMDLYWRADLAYAFILTSTGYPCVFYSDLFDAWGQARPYLVNLMWIHDNFAAGSLLERFADEDLYVFERQGNLLVGINDSDSDERMEWVKTDFGSFRQLHDYSGSSPNLWTNADGWARISVPRSGYVCYAPAGEGSQPAPARRRTLQEHEGNTDMDRPRAGEWWSEPVIFPAQAGSPIFLEASFEDQQGEVALALFDGNGELMLETRGSQGQVELEYLLPQYTSYYQARVALVPGAQSSGRRSAYWLKVDSMAPAVLPSTRPSEALSAQHLPALVP